MEPSELKGVEVGLVTFKASISRLKIKALLDKPTRKMLNSTDLSEEKSIKFGVYPNVAISRQQAQRFRYQPSGIIKEVKSVSFPRFTYIHFISCGIRNIEAFLFLEAPVLEEAHLITNRIAELKSIRKSFFPKLHVLGIDCNYILNTNTLSQLQHSLDLSWLSLDYRPKSEAQGDNGIVAKMRLESINYLICKSTRRVVNRKAKQMLKQRYPTINFNDRE